MPWIKVIEEGEAVGRLKEIYQEILEKRGKIANIMKIHSLNPEALKNHLDLYLTIMFRKPGLKRWERELVAVIVSRVNNCRYCIAHHSSALSRYWDEEKIKKFVENMEMNVLDDRTREIVRYAVKLTEKPSEVKEEDIFRLRRVGLTDEEILSLNLIISYFNFVNRIVLGLGVEYTDEELEGYRY